MPIRISHRVCGGLAGWWKHEPGMWDDEHSPNYISPSMLPLEPGQEVRCSKCGCCVEFRDMAWKKTSGSAGLTVYEQVMKQMNSFAVYDGREWREYDERI